MSETALRRAFADNGLWSEHEGTLAIVAVDDQRVGYIEFFRPIAYLDAYEIGYLLYDPQVAGRGYVTEAVRPLTDYLFQTRRFNRVELRIHPDNAASVRIADKAGYTRDGVARGAWHNDGIYHDLLVYGLLRAEWASGHGG